MLRTIVAMASLFAATAHAGVVERKISYSVDGTEFESTLVYEDVTGPARPGLVMVPNWYGAGAAAVAKAKMLAGSDYVILVTDVFGKDVRPTNDPDAGKAVKPLYTDRNVLRAQAGSSPLDAKRIGAIGFCFGGAAVLELVRSGGDIAGVATFHAALDTSMPAPANGLKGKTRVLVQNGADDSYVTSENIAAFEKEMKGAGADWTFVNHSGVVHCFTEPEATNPPGCVYDERVAKRSYALMHDFFGEVFGK